MATVKGTQLQPGDKFFYRQVGLCTVVKVRLDGDMWELEYMSPWLHKRNPTGVLYFHPEAEFEKVD